MLKNQHTCIEEEDGFMEKHPYFTVLYITGTILGGLVGVNGIIPANQGGGGWENSLSLTALIIIAIITYIFSEIILIYFLRKNNDENFWHFFWDNVGLIFNSLFFTGLLNLIQAIIRGVWPLINWLALITDITIFIAYILMIGLLIGIFIGLKKLIFELFVKRH
jgi:hypothetical protein